MSKDIVDPMEDLRALVGDLLGALETFAGGGWTGVLKSKLKESSCAICCFREAMSLRRSPKAGNDSVSILRRDSLAAIVMVARCSNLGDYTRCRPSHKKFPTP
jgi:hypothetical protein